MLESIGKVKHNRLKKSSLEKVIDSFVKSLDVSIVYTKADSELYIVSTDDMGRLTSLYDSITVLYNNIAIKDLWIKRFTSYSKGLNDINKFSTFLKQDIKSKIGGDVDGITK